MHNSSQPYLYNNSNNLYLLYCYSDNIQRFYYHNNYYARPWKIYWKNLDTEESHTVKTLRYHPDYGSAVIECNPHTYPEAPNVLYWNAGFCKGGNQPIVYYLVSMTFDDMSFSNGDPSTFRIISQCFTGTFINESLIIRHTGFKNAKLQIQDGNLLDFKDLGFKHLLKINRIYNDDKFILTGEDINNHNFSMLLDSSFNSISRLQNQSGEDIYKSTILNDRLIYTVKEQDESIETRRLVLEGFNYV